jgi:ABC-type antimicrobial peptide transport system permease subunit
MLTIAMLMGFGVTGVMMFMFTTENLKFYAVLNAMGATSRSLFGVILVQAGLCALIGTGLGLGVCAIAGRIFGACDFPAGGRTRRRTRSRRSVSRRPRSACRPSYGRTEWRGGEFRSMKAAWERITRGGGCQQGFARRFQTSAQAPMEIKERWPLF